MHLIKRLSQDLALLVSFALPIVCGSAADARALDAPSASTAVAGWEGFYAPETIAPSWLRLKGIPLEAASVLSPGLRVAKLVIAHSTQTSTAAQLDETFARFCTPRGVREWNEEQCAALEARRCDKGSCVYRDFGNCSGFLAGGGRFMTAAHCAYDLASDPVLASLSSIVVPGDHGRPARRLPLGTIALGKGSWVAAHEADPLDAASIEVQDDGLEPWPTAPLPPVGGVVYVYGYPRVDVRRSTEARSRAGYTLISGTPSLSFGRVTDRNEDDRPLCDADGEQEHWQLKSPCPPGDDTGDRGGGATGVIMDSPFLATYDTARGYSGAPVFDSLGALVGFNDTIIGGEDPAEGFFPSTRAVGTPAARALARFERAGGAPPPRRR